VVNAEGSPQAALDGLRRLAPDLILSQVSADDLARRLAIRTTPCFITARGSSSDMAQPHSAEVLLRRRSSLLHRRGLPAAPPFSARRALVAGD